MRCWWIVLAACGHEATSPTDRLIEIAEGAPALVRLLADPPPERPGSWPPWAQLEDGHLVLTPHCDVVPGTSGEPAVFELADAEGGEPIVVQVEPSIEGECEPRVIPCIGQNAAACAMPPMLPCPELPQRVATEFCADDATCRPDEVMGFALCNPDVNDPDLTARITTDAPIDFPLSADNNPRNFTKLTGFLYNANITGQFRISYEIARGKDNDSRIATGAYDLEWANNNVLLGIEPQFCIANDPCTIHHKQTRLSTGELCAFTTGNGVTVALRLWVRDSITDSVGNLHLHGDQTGGQSVGFHVPTGTALLTDINVDHDRESSIQVFADLGLPGQTAHIEMRACAAAPCANSDPGAQLDIKVVATEMDCQ